MVHEKLPLHYLMLLLCILAYESITVSTSHPAAGSSGRCMYFSTRGDHTGDILTWPWNAPPANDFTLEYWWREVDHHVYSHTILNYATFDENRSPMYDSGFELAVEQRYYYINFQRSWGFAGYCTCGWDDEIQTNGWVHVALTFDSKTGWTSYYVNGVRKRMRKAELDAWGDFGVPIVPGGMGMIGQQSTLYLGQYTHNLKADILLDELRVWDDVRTEDEIYLNQYVRIPRGTPGLNLAFDWDDLDGDDETVQDTSGNGNTAFVGKVAVGPNVLEFRDELRGSSKGAHKPTRPQYIYSGAPVSGGEPLVVPIRRDAVDSIAIKLLGADADGDDLTFSVTSLPIATLGALTQTRSGTDINPGDEVADTATNQVSFTLNPTTGLNMLETGSLEERQFTYTVTDPDGNSAEGVVELQLWVMPTPPNLTLRLTEDSLMQLPLSEVDAFGEMLTPVITEPPSRGELFLAKYTDGWTYDDLRSNLDQIKTPNVVVTAQGGLMACVAYKGEPNDSEGADIHDPDHSYTSFTYALETADGALRSEEATVTVRVAPVNDPPEGQDQFVTLNESLAYTRWRGSAGVGGGVGGYLFKKSSPSNGNGDRPSVEAGRADAAVVELTRLDIDAEPGARAYFEVTQRPSFGKLWQLDSNGEVGQEVVHEPTVEALSYVSHVPSVSDQNSYCGEVCWLVETCPKKALSQKSIPDLGGLGGGDDDDYYDPSVCNNRGYLGEQMVGLPDFYPRSGNSDLGWAPHGEAYNSGKSWVVLEFDTPLYLSELEIYEINQHGSVIEVASAPEYSGDVNTTDWTTLFSRPDAVPTPSQLFSPPLCPPTQLTSVVRLTLDTSGGSESEPSVIDAVKRMGRFQLDRGKLVSESVAYRPVPGIHGSSPDDPVDSFQYQASDCVDVSPSASMVTISIPPPTDAQAATPWGTTLASTFQLGEDDSAEAATEEGGVGEVLKAGDPARWVDAGIELVLAAEDAATQSSDSSSSFQSATVKYISGAAGAVYLVPRGSGSDTTDPPDMESAEPLKVGDKLGEGSDLAVYATLDHEPEVEVGVWVDTGVRTYRTRVLVSLKCPLSLERSVTGGGCDSLRNPCTSDHWEYSVSSCDASTESRHVTYSWVNSPDRGCNGNHRPEDVEIDCDVVLLESATGSVVRATAVLGVVVAIGFGLFLFINRTAPVVKAAQIRICYIYCLGAALFSLSQLAWLGPNTDVMCMLRPWVFHISLTVMFGALFVKVRRVKALFLNRKMKKKKITDKMLFKQLAVLLMFDVMFLTLGSGIQPIHSATQSRHEIGVGEVEAEVCNSDGNMFQSLMLVYKLGLIGYGTRLSFLTRNVDSKFSEATHIMLAIYNITFVGALVALVTAALDLERKSEVLLLGLGVGWCSIVSLSLVFVPKALRLKEKDRRSELSTKGTNSNARGMGRRSSTSGRSSSRHSRPMSRRLQFGASTDNSEESQHVFRGAKDGGRYKL